MKLSESRKRKEQPCESGVPIPRNGANHYDIVGTCVDTRRKAVRSMIMQMHIVS